MSIKASFNINGQLLDLSSPKVMGIINLTPDSFYDGGQNSHPAKYLNRIEQMISDGVDIVDIGAFSSRPGAVFVSEKEEEERLIKPLINIKKHFPEITISIDTYRSKIAEIAIKEGAGMINDITAGNGDEKMFETIAKLGVPYILMHIQGTPDTMQKSPKYENVVKEVLFYFEEKTVRLKSLGIKDIVLDPGFGFGKTVEHNYQLLRSLDLFQQLSFPIMAGISRKSMINKVLDIRPEEALNGTAVLHTLCLLKGVSILRVHDVKEAKEAIKLVSLYKETMI